MSEPLGFYSFFHFVTALFLQPFLSGKIHHRCSQ